MSSTAESDRIKALLTKTDEAIAANDLHVAFQALKEASKLEPDNDGVKERWTTLQSQDSGGNAFELLRHYIASGKDEDGQKAVDALRQNTLSADDAVQAMELLLVPRDDLQSLDTVTGTLLSRNVDARTFVTKKIRTSSTEVFEVIFERGDKSFDAYASISLDKSLWASPESQATLQQDIFQLCVAKLVEAGEEHFERAMKCIARLLNSVPETVVSLVDADDFDAILSCLDIRLEAPLRAQTMIASSKFFEATKDTGHELFRKFITDRAAKQTYDDLIIVFSAAAAVFPLVPSVAAELFLRDGFIQQLVPNLEQNWDHGAAGERKSHHLETAALELLSAACVDKPCREAIKRYCSHWLENLTEEREGTHRSLAALVLAKISGDSPESITAKLQAVILNNDSDISQAVEGMAYLSTRPSVKKQIADNNELVKKIIGALRSKVPPFGCLAVLNNLVAYRSPMSEEQKKISQLQAYANSSKPEPQDPLENDDEVARRCKKLLDADVVPALVKCWSQTASPTNVAYIVRILLALAQEQKNRPKMVQQGAVKLLLQITAQIRKSDVAELQATAQQALHALARLLISVNPSHVFSSTLPASSAVSALAPLLGKDPTWQDGSERSLLPTFEGLLALTNLASMQDDSIRESVLRLSWEELEDRLLLSSNQLVQRASVELLCNVMASPAAVAKFVDDGSGREKTRLHILLAIASMDDFATRRAGGGALAMLTEWPAAIDAILEDRNDKDEQNGVKNLLSLCAEPNDEIKHRGLVCISNLVDAQKPLGQRCIERVKDEDGVNIVSDAVRATKDRDIKAVGIKVLKKIT